MRSRRKYVAAVAVDKILGLLASVLRSNGGPRPLPQNPRVLLVRCDHIGDAVMATAVLEPIRNQLKPSRLDVVAGSWAASLFMAHPAVDRVFEYDTPWWLGARRATLGRRMRAWGQLPALVRNLRQAQYDVAIDLRGDMRQILFFLVLSGAKERVSSNRTGGTPLLTRWWTNDPSFHEVEKNLAILATLDVHGGGNLSPPSLPILPLGVEAALDRFSSAGGFITMALWGNKPNRSWAVDEAARFASLLFERLGMGVVLLGGPAQQQLCDNVRELSPHAVINLAGSTTLMESCAVIARSRAMVAVDSGPMHLAALIGSPVVALFGPGDPNLFGPRGENVLVIRTPGRCLCEGETCDRTLSGFAACMAELPAERVLEGLTTLLQEEVASRPLIANRLKAGAAGLLPRLASLPPEGN